MGKRTLRRSPRSSDGSEADSDGDGTLVPHRGGDNNNSNTNSDGDMQQADTAPTRRLRRRRKLLRGADSSDSNDDGGEGSGHHGDAEGESAGARQEGCSSRQAESDSADNLVDDIMSSILHRDSSSSSPPPSQNTRRHTKSRRTSPQKGATCPASVVLSSSSASSSDDDDDDGGRRKARRAVASRRNGSDASGSDVDVAAMLQGSPRDSSDSDAPVILSPSRRKAKANGPQQHGPVRRSTRRIFNEKQQAMERLKQQRLQRRQGSSQPLVAQAESESEHSDAGLGVDDEDEEDFVVDDDHVDVSENVDCKCGATSSAGYTGLWARCSHELCKTWQHAACYGFKTEDDIPDEFQCDRCLTIQNVPLDDIVQKAEQSEGLYLAVEANDLAAVRERIADLACDVDWINVDDQTKTALHRAAEIGNPDVIRLLLSQKPSTARVDLDNMAPVCYAVKGGHIEAARLLLEATKESDVVPNAREETLMHLATDQPGAAMVQLLLNSSHRQRSLDAISCMDAEERTPLARAAQNGNLPAFQLLGKQPQAVFDFETTNGCNLIHFAATGGNSSILQHILHRAPEIMLAAPDMDGSPPLFYAARNGHDAFISMLLAYGAPVNCRDKIGISALHTAAAEGHASTVQLLIDAGHTVDCTDDCHWPPLLYANFEANEQCVLSLLRAKPEQLMQLGQLRRRSDLSQELRDKTMKVIRNTVTSLATQDAYYRFLNDFVATSPSMLDEELSFLLGYKGLLDFNNRLSWFRRLLQRNAPRHRAFSLVVERGMELECAVETFGRLTGHDLLTAVYQPPSVTFRSEPGTCLGPRREAFDNICRALVADSRQLFVACKGGDASLYFPQALCDEHGQLGCQTSESMAPRLELFEFTGRFVGLVLASAETIPLRLARPFWKKVLDADSVMTLDDLEVVDAEMCTGLTWALNNDITDVLDRTFSNDMVDVITLTHEIALDPTGKVPPETEVTEENKADYVRLLVNLLLSRAIEAEVGAFRRGLFNVLPLESLPFNADELSLMLNGVAELDPVAWEASTIYRGLSRNDDAVKWFWKLVRSMTAQERVLLLQFATGSSSLPLGGFNELQGLHGPAPFQLCHKIDSSELPTASTCFNMLKLPRYESESELRRKVLIAVRYGSQGFSFS
eukprot:m.142867 g.142867  ORF g.142867 m.142867 type:complete len:1142 (-) comp17149_c0_seq5:93-3518(-)